MPVTKALARIPPTQSWRSRRDAPATITKGS